MGGIRQLTKLVLLSTALIVSQVVDSESSKTRTIETRQGAVEGLSETARDGSLFYSFYGIPFAEPPLGQLRFRAPQPAKAWEGTLDAKEARSECLYDNPVDPRVVEGSEDCLYLNVFTKHPGDPNAKRPVVVWIHGGAFIFGGAGLYRPQYVMEEDVVLVVIQYRLNMFGFLSFEDAAAPGNYGMMDQVEAIRWVQKHISDYGGDPGSVTLTGMSAGGASVHYHMLSPQSRGLFKNAISLSGSSLNWWANIRRPKKHADKLAEVTGCKNEKTEEILDCLRKIPAGELFAKHGEFFDWRKEGQEREPMNVFSPRPDPESSNPFLPEHPVIAMSKGNINSAPYMLGYAEKEGGWRANYVLPDVPDSQIWKQFVEGFDELAPLAFGINDETSNVKDTLSKIVEFYKLKEMSEMTEEKAESMVDVQSDTMFNYGIDKTAKLHSEKAPKDTYFYHLTYPGKHTLTNFGSDHDMRPPKWKVLAMATHGTDMLLMFPMFPFDPMPEADIQVSRKFIKLLVDFATNGKSSAYPNWKPLKTDDPKVLNIGKEFLVEEGLPYQENFRFWDGLDVYWNNFLKESSNVKDEL